MFENFDKSVLTDPEFQEDAVREDIVAPTLKILGYSASGNAKIVRSRKLIHPFVSIGSKRTKINIIPDYVLEIEGEPKVILDAKSPHTSLKQSKHAEQAYSYAIHPDIRANIYSLCNGNEWIIWDIDRFEPVAELTMDDLITNFHLLEKFLSPSAVLFPEKRSFLRDFGLTVLKMGFTENTTQHFIANQIGNIVKIEDDLYTTNVQIDFGDEKHAISFDMNKEIFTSLLSLFPEPTKTQIIEALSRQPYSVFGLDPIWVTIAGKFGMVQQGESEDFIPIVIESVKPIAING